MPYGNHTMLSATGQRWESRLYPQPKQVLDLATRRDARLSWPMLRKSGQACLKTVGTCCVFNAFFKMQKTWLFTFLWVAAHVFSSIGIIVCRRKKLNGSYTIWLCCVEWNEHNTVFGSKSSAVHKLFTSCIRRGLVSVSRDSIVYGDWLPATEWCQRYLAYCQPVSDVVENLGRFNVHSVQARGMTLNWFQR